MPDVNHGDTQRSRLELASALFTQTEKMLNGRMGCASRASRGAQNATTADGQHGMIKPKNWQHNFD